MPKLATTGRKLSHATNNSIVGSSKFKDAKDFAKYNMYAKKLHEIAKNCDKIKELRDELSAYICLTKDCSNIRILEFCLYISGKPESKEKIQ